MGRTSVFLSSLFFMVAGGTSRAAVINLDVPAITIAPGGVSGPIGATLLADASGRFVTDQNAGFPYYLDNVEYTWGSVSFYQQSLGAIFLLPGTAQQLFLRSETFTPGDDSQLRNVSLLNSGDSVHLDLGTISVSDAVAPGSYTVDIGLAVDSSPCPPALPAGSFCTGFMSLPLGTLSPAPDIGALLTVNVVTEPPGIALLALGVAGSLMVRARRRPM